MKLLFGILFIVLLAYTAPAPAQTHRYEVWLGNRVMGTMQAQCTVNGAVKTISIMSKGQYKLLSSKFNQYITSEYRDNILIRSEGSRPGDNISTITSREGNNYSLLKNGKQTILYNAVIRYCVSDLYFTEPQHVTQVFSETLGQFLPLKPLGNGYYELLLPDDKKNIYHYEKGRLITVEVDRALGKIYIRPVR